MMYTIRYDKEVDAFYVRFREGEIAETIEFREGVFVDLDADGRTIGIEALDAHTNGFIARSDELKIPDRITEDDLVGAD
jgi:uncharacterized protein YuzE